MVHCTLSIHPLLQLKIHQTCLTKLCKMSYSSVYDIYLRNSLIHLCPLSLKTFLYQSQVPQWWWWIHFSHTQAVTVSLLLWNNASNFIGSLLLLNFGDRKQWVIDHTISCLVSLVRVMNHKSIMHDLKNYSLHWPAPLANFITAYTWLLTTRSFKLVWFFSKTILGDFLLASFMAVVLAVWGFNKCHEM